MLPKKTLIGYKLNDALLELSNEKEIIVNVTKSPNINISDVANRYNHIVVKHTEDENNVYLTVSYFK